MKISSYVTLGAALILLAGCGSALQDGVPSAAAQSSWIKAEAKSSDLLYVTDMGTNDVYVYSYPQGSLVGTLSGFDSPVRDCSDRSGNVYVTNTTAETILEYPHGGTKPIKTFSDKGFLPVDCSVDPTTGTLAVTNYGPSGSNTGSVALYTNGKAKAKFYNASGVQAYLFCAYDDSGNLYVNGLLDRSYDYVFIELPKGASKFETITLNETFGTPGGVAWDGTYVAVGDGTTIYDFAIKGTKGTKVRTITLGDAVNVEQFTIKGSTLIAPDGPNGANHDVGFWNYPAGGDPTKTIGSGLLENPSSATVSKAP